MPSVEVQKEFTRELSGLIVKVHVGQVAATITAALVRPRMSPKEAVRVYRQVLAELDAGGD